MEGKHTRGPWRVAHGSDNLTGLSPATVVGPLGFPVAEVCRPDANQGGCHLANSALLSASPELLFSLRELLPLAAAGVKLVNGQMAASSRCRAINLAALARAEAAIAKATGQ